MGALETALCERLGTRMDAEHRMMDCLAEALWEAQRRGGMPDETAYLACLRGLQGDGKGVD